MTTPVTLTNWSLLDYQLLANQINTFFGSTVVTHAALLDPKLFEDQVNAAVGSAVYRASGPLDKGLTDPKWSPPDLMAAIGD